ncbi:MAG: beta-ketoacyl-ACP synthase II [Planctomycetota bacterium]
MPERRVVITGLGWVTSLGTSVPEVFERLCQGHSGIKPITRFDANAHGVTFGGECTDFTPEPQVDHRTAKKLDRFSQLAVCAAVDAVDNAKLDFEQEDPFRCGAIIGSGVGGIEEFAEGHAKMLDKGPTRISPFMVPKLMCNAAPGNVAIRFGLKGPNYATTSACASAGHAIGAAYDQIRAGHADVIVTGGAEAALTPLGLATFVVLKALSKRNDDPEKASRPFDQDRDGFVLAEGAGIVILESLEHAQARGAQPVAEMLGWGQSNDGHHITAPLEHGEGAAAAMTAALNHSGLQPADIDYINAHGTSTGLGDLAETRAVRSVFGQDAPPTSSTKSMLGHLLGASGGVETIICTQALQTGLCPPTINHENPGEGCDLDYLPNQARQVNPRVVLNNSFGFGGHNTSLAFAKFE